jgi:hypothetical protein
MSVRFAIPVNATLHSDYRNERRAGDAICGYVTNQKGATELGELLRTHATLFLARSPILAMG